MKLICLFSLVMTLLINLASPSWADSPAPEPESSEQKTRADRRKVCLLGVAALGVGLLSLTDIPDQGITAVGLGGNLDQSYLPHKEGYYWVYAVSSPGKENREIKISIGPKEKLITDHEEDTIEAQSVLVNDQPGRQYLLVNDEEIQIIRQDTVGFAGELSNITDEKYLLSKATWEFYRMEGCILNTIHGRRIGSRTLVTLPSGQFRTAHFRLSSQGTTMETWFAPGVGIVKQEKTVENGTETWVLIDAHPDLLPAPHRHRDDDVRRLTQPRPPNHIKLD